MKNTIRKISKKEYKLSKEIPQTMDELALGTSVRRDIIIPKKYLEDIKDYTEIRDPGEIHKVIELCNRLLYTEPIIGAAVDVLTAFTGTDLKIENVPDDDAMLLLEYFLDHVNEYNENTGKGIKSLLEQFYLEWWTAGNLIPRQAWVWVADLEGTEVSKFDPLAKNGDMSPFDYYGKSGEYFLPLFLDLLNPLSITVDTTSFGKRRLKFKPSDELVAAAQGKRGADKSLLKEIPKDWLQYLKQGKDVLLDPRFFTHLGRMRRNYDESGIPYLANAFSGIATLKRLRRLDNSTIDGLINSIVVFKVGTETFPASELRLNKFRNLIRKPDPSMVIIWGHDIDILEVGPNQEVLGMDTRFDEANEEIFDSLGIPKFLISGRESFSGPDWVAMMMLSKKAEPLRLAVESYLSDLFRKIMLAQKDEKFHEIYPKATLTRINVRNEAEFRSFVLRLFDRGGLSIRTALEEAGYTYAAERDRKIEQRDDKEKDLWIPPKLPFSGRGGGFEASPSPQGGRPDTPGEETEEEPTIEEEAASLKYSFGKERTAFNRALNDKLMAIYNSMKDRLYQIYKTKKEVLGEPLTLEQIRAELLVGFTQLRRITGTALGGIFDEYYFSIPERKTPEQSLLRQRLIAWNEHYLDKFMTDLSHKLANTSVIEDLEMVGAAILGVFTEHESRMKLYASEGPRVSILLGRLALSDGRGYAGGYWVTAGDEKVCDVCGMRDGEWYAINELRELVNPHISCRCDVDYTFDNKLLAGETKNRPVVRAHPKKGGKVL